MKARAFGQKFNEHLNYNLPTINNSINFDKIAGPKYPIHTMSKTDLIKEIRMKQRQLDKISHVALHLGDFEKSIK